MGGEFKKKKSKTKLDKQNKGKQTKSLRETFYSVDNRIFFVSVVRFSLSGSFTSAVA